MNPHPTTLMKALSAPAGFGRVLATVILLLVSLSQANAGFLDLLRGEAAAPEPSYQKVAFIGSARVKEASGQAERLTGIDAWRLLEKGAELAPGDLIRTRQGTVVLRMQESGSFIKVTPQTILRLLPCEERWDRSVLSGREENAGFIVRSCRGKAFVRNPGEDWKNVEVNTVLAEGCELRTEPGAIVDLYNTKRQRPLRIEGSVVVKLHENAFVDRVLVQPDLVAAALR